MSAQTGKTESLKVMSKSAALKAAGKDVINWHIGTSFAKVTPNRTAQNMLSAGTIHWGM